jgi:hypothetical protein
VDWIAADALYDYNVPDGLQNTRNPGLPFFDYSPFGIGHPAPVTGGVLYDSEVIRILLQHSGYDLVSARDGLLLFGKRNLVESRSFITDIAVSDRPSDQDLVARFGDSIGLTNFSLESVGERRFLLSYDWVPLKPLSTAPLHFAVTTLDGVPNARFVHLSTQVLYPTTQWGVDEVIHERFEIRIPDTVKRGIYRLNVSWYDSDHLYAAWTDSRSRLGPTVLVGTVTIEN